MELQLYNFLFAAGTASLSVGLSWLVAYYLFGRNSWIDKAAIILVIFFTVIGFQNNSPKLTVSAPVAPYQPGFVDVETIEETTETRFGKFDERINSEIVD